MKTLYKKASHLRAHTWKDIGGIGGLLLDAAFFVFLVVMSVIMMFVGLIAVVFAYLAYPVFALLSRCRGTQKLERGEQTLRP
jgi:hypothetical protein